MTGDRCLFCDRTQHTILGETTLWNLLLDNFPASPGHLLIVPSRHVDRYSDLDDAEQAELGRVVAYAQNLISAKVGEPDGWTVGINDGTAAGRSIDHLHVHLIPRHHGDVADPRGGIRQCAPGCTPDEWTETADV